MAERIETLHNEDETIDIYPRTKTEAITDGDGRDFSEIIGEKTDKANFAKLSNVYDATATYAVGDLCIYDDVIYRCITAITSPEAFNSTHWQYFKLGNVAELEYTVVSVW